VVDVRDRLLDAAEEVCAERGVAALSLREVQQRAGQRNKSAAAYHFGSRHGLLCALADRRLGPIDAGRRALLDQIAAEGRDDDVRALVEVLVLPMASVIEEGRTHWAGFLAQTVADPMLSELITQRAGAGAFREMIERLVAIMQARLPHPLPTLRINHIISLTIHRLADFESGRSIATKDDLVADLVDVCVAIITAPVGVDHG